jgi:nitroreductase
MDTFLAITSKRDTRRYAEQPIHEETLLRILDAGRLAGSAKNRQPWQFLVVESPERRNELAEAVYEPGNVLGAQLVVAIAGTAKQFDMGRAAQNMLLAAWNDGVGSCPNGIKDAEAAERIVGAPVSIVLTFGYPAKPRHPDSRSAEEWSARAKRKPFDEVVRRI